MPNVEQNGFKKILRFCVKLTSAGLENVTLAYQLLIMYAVLIY